MGDLTYKVPKGFLRRKFTAPQLPSPFVREERMSALIMREDGWRVCLINASAGYGKTVLMSQWHHDFSQREDCVSLWMTLDERDVAVERLIRGLAYLLSQVDPRFLEAFAGDGPIDDVELALTDLVNLIDELCDPDMRYFVFLDDYDSVAASSFDRALLFLNRFCGDNFRFVIAGSWFSPQIDDLLLDSSVVEYRTPDLAFDRKRLKEYALSLMPDLTEGEFDEICRTSGTWPTAFSFNGLARKRSHGGDCAKVLDGYYRRFFVKEVMARLDATAYEFLVETAFLEWLDPDLCDCVTGGGNARTVLEFLEQRNLFVHYDEELGAYVHQPTFRRFLMDKTLSLHFGYLSKLTRRAAGWFAARGLRNERARCVSAACDESYVRGIIESSTGIAVDLGCASFSEYLLMRPAERFSQDAYLALVAAWAFISIGVPDEARYWLEVARGLDADGPFALVYGYADAICLSLEGDSRSSLLVVRKILAEGGGGLPLALQSLLVHSEGENVERMGDPKGARDLYLKALSLAERAGGVFFEIFDLYCLACNRLDAGDLDEASALAARAIALCEEGSPMFGEMHAVIASVAVERCELEAARAHLEIACDCVSSSVNIDMYLDVMCSKARYELARGNPIEAYEILREALGSTDGKKVPRCVDMNAYALLTRLAVDLEETSTVRRCERALDRFMDSLDFFRVSPCMMAKAHVLWSRGEQEACFEALEQCRKVVQADGSSLHLVELCAFEAALWVKRGNETRAMAEISKALEIAMRRGYLMTLLHAGGAAVRGLVLKVATNRKTSSHLRAYAKRVLLLYGAEPEAIGEASGLEGEARGYYTLTKREREILQALNAGMSRRELAEHLGVSQNTVKTHLKNVYTKLGVHTRAEAYQASQAAEVS